LQLLKKEIAIQQERSQQKNLAEAAAEKSAQLLQQMQARTHVGAGVLVIAHMVYLLIGIFSVLATALIGRYDRIEA
jgi:hypothetical protein